MEGCVSVLDGIGDDTTYLDLRSFFAQAGRIKGVFLSRTKKSGRKSRFGFIRYVFDVDARGAVEQFDGALLKKARLSVSFAKYPIKQHVNGGRVMKGQSPRQVEKRWEPKAPKQTMVWRSKEGSRQKGRPSELKPDFIFKSQDAERERVQRLAEATLWGVVSKEMVQDFLITNGFSHIGVISMGAREVILEFPSRAEMEETLQESSDFLSQMFQVLKPCSARSVARNHLIWLRLYGVPVVAWCYEFFQALASVFGNLVCLDGATSSWSRLDVARILVESTVPVVREGVIMVRLDDELVPVTVVKEPGWGQLVAAQPVRPVADPVNGSDESASEASAEDHAVTAEMNEMPGSGYKSYDKEGPVADNLVVTLTHLREAGYSVEELMVLPCFKHLSNAQEDLHEKNEGMTVSNILNPQPSNVLLTSNEGENLIAKNQGGSFVGFKYEGNGVRWGHGTGFWNSNDVGNRLCAKPWNVWLNSRSAANFLGANSKIKEFVIKSVGTAETEIKDVEKDGQMSRTGWLLKKPLTGGRISVLKLKALARLNVGGSETLKITVGQKMGASQINFEEPIPAKNCKFETGIEDHVETEFEERVYSDDAILAAVKQRRGRNKGGIPGGTRGRKLDGKSRAKRGRPKGSKNKPKKQRVEEEVHAWSDEDSGGEGISSRARQTWRLAKRLGVVYNGADEEMIRRLEIQIRENHPNLQ
ncbi:uncharacterized protein LOC130737693 [Lotus japonicus]|uniref:uncharacterized protein LOC130737693 n=1 Tax=Lotus japonicus TaxID=34305 RepID=UPI00258B6736|nr:uncharacterized protein LOC130737693 [Lotus japonicus]